MRSGELLKSWGWKVWTSLGSADLRLRRPHQPEGGSEASFRQRLLLRVDYKTLHLKIKHYGIEAEEFRAS